MLEQSRQGSQPKVLVPILRDAVRGTVRIISRRAATVLIDKDKPVRGVCVGLEEEASLACAAVVVDERARTADALPGAVEACVADLAKALLQVLALLEADVFVGSRRAALQVGGLAASATIAVVATHSRMNGHVNRACPVRQLGVELGRRERFEVGRERAVDLVFVGRARVLGITVAV